MATEAIQPAPHEKGITETTAPKFQDQHQDVESGPEMVNIDRIEKVYA
jgi:hypothetical protein